MIKCNSWGWRGVEDLAHKREGGESRKMEGVGKIPPEKADTGKEGLGLRHWSLQCPYKAMAEALPHFCSSHPLSLQPHTSPKKTTSLLTSVSFYLF